MLQATKKIDSNRIGWFHIFYFISPPHLKGSNFICLTLNNILNFKSDTAPSKADLNYFNSEFMKKRSLINTSLLLTALSPCASAQLTWSPLTTDWDLTTDNWEDASSSFVVWDNTGAQEAIFPVGEIVDVADGGVTVGNLSTSGILSLGSTTDNLGLITIAPGGATWNTGGTEIEFRNGGLDTPLSISPDDTLAVTGGGTFDTGERPNGANWIAADATLDIIEATVVLGNSGSVGQFGTLRIGDGSRYIHERNSDQAYANNWELELGTISFNNRFNRNYTLNGDISGDGGMRVEFMENQQIVLNGDNTFTGGLEVSNASRVTADADSVGPGDLILSGSTDTNGGILRLLGTVALGERTLTLNGTGGSIVNAGLISLDGDIVGDGNLQIGNTAFNTNTNVITLSGSGDYTGNTNIVLGSINLGADEALSSSILTLGGPRNSSRLILNGHTQTITGLAAVQNNTRQIVNLNATSTGSTPGTLILDIADQADVDQEYNFVSAFGVLEGDDRGNFNTVKNGDGTIRLGNIRIAGTVDVNAGELRIGDSNGISAVGSVTNNANLVIDEATTASSLTTGANSSNTFNWEVSDWTGTAGAGYTQLTVTGDVTLDASSSLTIAVEEIDLANFTENNTSFVVATVAGTTTPSTATLAVDASGFTSGTGTWAVRLDGNNIVLDYTSEASEADSYAAWTVDFPTLTGEFGDDDDGDGVANGLEYYFFNSDPTVANSLPDPLAVQSSAGNGDLVFSHDRPIGSNGATATYEWSTNLDGIWTASGDSNDGTTVTITPGTTTASAPGYETVEVTTSSLPATLQRLFVRLSLSRP